MMMMMMMMAMDPESMHGETHAFTSRLSSNPQRWCPISLIHVSEIRMPVSIRGQPQTVYEAEHLLQWLKNYELKDPATNLPVPPGHAVDLVVPRRLGHTTDSDMLSTCQMLCACGYLDRRKKREGEDNDGNLFVMGARWAFSIAFALLGMWIAIRLLQRKCACATIGGAEAISSEVWELVGLMMLLLWLMYGNGATHRLHIWIDCLLVALECVLCLYLWLLCLSLLTGWPKHETIADMLGVCAVRA